MNTKLAIFLCCSLILLFAPAVAQVEIDRSLPVTGNPEIWVENLFGEIEIVAWAKNEVRVTGQLAPGAEGLEFDVEEMEVEIEVSSPDHWFYESDDDTEYRSRLVVQVPAGSSVGVETVNATVKVIDVTGTIEIETINGDVTISGDPSSVEIESMTGSIEVYAVAAEMEVETVSGNVTLYGARHGAGVESISGTVTIHGSSMEEVSVETVSGNVTLDLSLLFESEVDIETHSGNVELTFPSEVRAQFSVSTFNGVITNDIGPAPRRTSRFEPYTELRFSTGMVDCDVAVETFSGDVTLQTR